MGCNTPLLSWLKIRKSGTAPIPSPLTIALLTISILFDANTVCACASAISAGLRNGQSCNLPVGFGYWRQLWVIELPLARPFIIAGLRIASTTLIGIATVAAYINAGGLGSIIFAGLEQRYPEKIFVGGGLTALLAISVDLLFLGVQRRMARKTQREVQA